MARATNVYVLTWADRTPYATFTVKHELVSFLKLLSQVEPRSKIEGWDGTYVAVDLDYAWVARMPDGRPRGSAIPIWPARQFLEENDK